MTRRSAKSDASDPPFRAMNWSGDALRRHSVLATWRGAVFEHAGSGGRAIRVAWTLASLFHRDRGFCHASDRALARLARVDISHLPSALRLLEDKGLILRTTARRGSKVERRIWPRLPGSTAGKDEVDPPNQRVISDPPFQQEGTRRFGGTEIIEERGTPPRSRKGVIERIAS